MIFTSTGLEGAYVIDVEQNVDERGFFARTFCREEFRHAGLVSEFEQESLSRNSLRGTLRGMHYQTEPHAETKIVRCTRGAIHDVIVDLRPQSPTYCCWVGVELSADNARALYVPRGFAHGFVTLTDLTDVAYAISTPFHAGSARGVRWNDPALAIEWPLAPVVISGRDAAYEDFRR